MTQYITNVVGSLAQCASDLFETWRYINMFWFIDWWCV